MTKVFEGYFFFGRAYPADRLGRGRRSCSRWSSAARLPGAAQVPRQLPPVPHLPRATGSAMRARATPRCGAWQVVTGFALFFLASVHLYQMLMHPGAIGPFESADRVWSGRWWPLYLVLLFAVELHGGIGLYRLAVKWGWLAGRRSRRRRAAA
ncbi:MAG: hypothetical protein MZW92_80125 [Comamonadaceae bacterium]|nr:hypothetical protein [Comamonadaceae bacterium]